MLNIVLIGSAALHRIIPSVKIGLDLDYIMTFDDFQKFVETLSGVRACYPINRGKKYVVKTDDVIYEVEIAWEGSTAEEFMNLVMNEKPIHKFGTLGKGGISYWVPSLDALYAMKMSHRYLKNSQHFLKTMNHIKLMREHWDESRGNYDVIGYWQDWYERRQKETYDYAHPNLTVAKNDFFKDETFYKYDHDDIHEAVKLSDIPAYKRIIADGYQVKCDRDKFLNLPLEQKLQCALEECYTLSLERSLIPFEFKTEPEKVFDIALMKVCTSITSGWFREWCWENYTFIKFNYSSEFVEKFKQALADGKIRPFTHDRYKQEAQ